VLTPKFSVATEFCLKIKILFSPTYSVDVGKGRWEYGDISGSELREDVIFNNWCHKMSHLVEALSSKVTLCLPLSLRFSQVRRSEVASGDVLGEGGLGRNQ
jgi:hypothetical protein